MCQKIKSRLLNYRWSLSKEQTRMHC